MSRSKYVTSRELTTLVALEENKPGQENAHGQLQDKWKEHGCEWASIEQITSTKFTFAEQQYPTATHRVKMRFRPDLNITSTWRIREIVSERKLYIVGPPDNTNRANQELVLICSEHPG
jgi:SPP1 family predicted phage head-tail adaptor